MSGHNCKRILLGGLFLGMLLVAGCKNCLPPPPPYPSPVRGWQPWTISYNETVLRYQGEIVLKVGESSDNGKIGIKLVEIIPSRCSGLFAERSPHDPWVTYELYSPSNSAVRCRFTAPYGGGPNQCKGLANDEYIDVSIKAVNQDQNWAHIVIGG